VAAQGQVQDYSFVTGESLATRVVAQVPKQWLVGYDAPAETLSVVVAAAVVVSAVWLALARTDAREQRAFKLGAGVGVAALGIALVLAVAGADYFLSRYVLAAFMPLTIVVATGLGAHRSGRLGVALAAGLCALFAFVVVSVSARPELQRDDWRGIARTLGPPPPGGRAIVVSPINGRIPLGLYLHGLTRLPASGVPVTEVDAVAVAQRVAGETRSAPQVRPVPSPPGFREVARRRGPTYTVVRYRADTPLPVSPAQLGSFALLTGPPDYVLQP
jgi:hypothetical protein